MYSILIVDDERNERTGIERLIHRYQYDLKIYQACNGEEALKVFEDKKIDILLTDIKMPFMTGMELIEEVHKRGWDPVCIIYSAYGEFEYAQNAISLGVLQYLLKPIRLEEFQKLFQKVFHVCEERKNSRLQNEKMQEAQKRVSDEKTGRALIRYLESESAEGEEAYRSAFGGQDVYPVILSSYLYLFSRYWDDYVFEIKEKFPDSTLIINRDDTQVLLLVPHMEKMHKKDVETACEGLIEISKKKYQSELLIIVGKCCCSVRQLKSEYEKMKEQLDYQFFLTESICLVEDKGAFLKKEKDMLPIYFKRILTNAKLKDFEGIRTEFEKAFDYVEENMGFSSVYIKYNFSEIIKKCCEALHKEERMMEIVENIYGARSLREVKDAALYLIHEFEQEQEEVRDENRVVMLAKDIISEEYGNSTLSVSLLAEKLGISAAYLSSLFKMETGENLVKYISRYRMEKAKQLLNTTNMKIGDIAERVGYFNTSYFISLFRTNEGCSPAKFREKN
ncbi:response regulator [Blautia schinkii]|nr:response regulator [Blautia schinkii]